MNGDFEMLLFSVDEGARFKRILVYCNSEQQAIEYLVSQGYIRENIYYECDIEAVVHCENLK